MLIFNISILLIVFLALYRIPKTLKNDYSYLNRDSTTTLRGVAILGIVLHHIALHTDYNVNKIPLVSLIINECGFPCTALFFLFSGFGCWISLSNLIAKNPKNSGGGYISFKWGIKHVFQLYFIYAISLIIAISVYYGLTPNSVTLKEILLAIPLMRCPYAAHWFPIIQVFCYVVTALSFAISKKHNDIIIVLLVIAFMVIARLSGLPTYWYNSIIAFPIGVIFSKYGKGISIKKNINLIICILSGSVFFFALIGQAYLYSRSYLVSDLLRVFASAILCIFIITLTKTGSINNKLLKEIGNASFECFFMHWVAICTLRYFDIESNIAVAVILISTVIVAIPIHKLVKMFFNKMDKKV